MLEYTELLEILSQIENIKGISFRAADDNKKDLCVDFNLKSIKYLKQSVEFINFIINFLEKDKSGKEIESFNVKNILVTETFNFKEVKNEPK